jgi:catechol 2,3-dioxygenase-like lactoylglutathione lyase family enzyme
VGALSSIGAITMFVDDPQRSKAFYERAFATPAVWEDANSVVFELENTLINLLEISQAPGLIGPAPVAPPGSGSSFQLTIWVDDVDDVCRDLAGRGVSIVNGPIDRPWGVRTAAFTDPDGHVWEVAQQLAKNDAA